MSSDAWWLARCSFISLLLHSINTSIKSLNSPRNSYDLVLLTLTIIFVILLLIVTMIQFEYIHSFIARKRKTHTSLINRCPVANIAKVFCVIKNIHVYDIMVMDYMWAQQFVDGYLIVLLFKVQVYIVYLYTLYVYIHIVCRFCTTNKCYNKCNKLWLKFIVYLEEMNEINA